MLFPKERMLDAEMVPDPVDHDRLKNVYLLSCTTTNNRRCLNSYNNTQDYSGSIRSLSVLLRAISSAPNNTVTSSIEFTNQPFYAREHGHPGCEVQFGSEWLLLAPEYERAGAPKRHCISIFAPLMRRVVCPTCHLSCYSTNAPVAFVHCTDII